MKIPETMRAVAFDRHGGPSVLSMHELPVPAVGANEVLIAVHTAGVGEWVAWMRAGPAESEHAHFPKVLGTDGSGTIASVGSRVRRLDVGDHVFAYGYENPKGGFYAQYVAIPAMNVARIPDGYDLEEAGAATVTSLTALQIPIAKTYTLANAVRAHQRLAEGHVLGKIVLRVAEK